MSRSQTWQWTFRLFFILTPLLAVPCLAYGQSCDIDADHIGDIRIGGSKAEVLAQLSSRYTVTEPKQQATVPTLIARLHGDSSNSRPLVVVNFVNDHAFLIDSYEPCVTKEGVGRGTTLERARQVYGQGSIDPTDLGYFVWFGRKKGVMFLLDSEGIPASSRGIPDDVLTPERERQILSLGKVRIVAVRVAGS